jgi:hypothetical protein
MAKILLLSTLWTREIDPWAEMQRSKFKLDLLLFSSVNKYY